MGQEVFHGFQLGQQQVLAVGGTPAADAAVNNIPGEGVKFPLAPVADFHHVLVAHEQQGLLAAAGSFQMELETGLPHFVQFHELVNMGVKLFKQGMEFFKFLPIHLVHVGVGHGGTANHGLQMRSQFFIFLGQTHFSAPSHHAGIKLPLQFCSIYSLTAGLWKIFTNFW